MVVLVQQSTVSKLTLQLNLKWVTSSHFQQAAGALEEEEVTAVTNNTTITISAAMTNGVTSVVATRKRAQLTDQNKNILLRKLQKGGIKTLKTENNSGVSDTSVVVRRSFEDVSTVGGQVSFSWCKRNL